VAIIFVKAPAGNPELPTVFQRARTRFDLSQPEKLSPGGHRRKNRRNHRWQHPRHHLESEIPLAVAGFAYGDYKVANDKAGEVAVDIYATENPMT